MVWHRKEQLVDHGEVSWEVLRLTLFRIHVATVNPRGHCVLNHPRLQGLNLGYPILAMHQAGSSSFALWGPD